MKKWTVVFLILTAAGAIFGRGLEDGGSGSEPRVPVGFVVPGGAPLAAVALLELDRIDPLYDVNLDVVESADLIAAKIIGGEADLAVVPSNLAAVLASRGTGIRMVGPVIWGILYVVASEDLGGMAALEGRTIHTIGRGLTPDITVRHLLEENGLVPDADVEISYASSAAELAPTFLTGRTTVSMMPEPMITAVLAKKPETIILVDIQEEWRRRYGSSYPQASLVVRGAFAADNPGFLAKFAASFDAAVEEAKANPQAAGQSAARLSPAVNPDIFSAAIARMNLGFVPAAEARGALEDYYSVLKDFNPATIGGKMPLDDFYLP